jgi:hypothetical protein
MGKTMVLSFPQRTREASSLALLHAEKLLHLRRRVAVLSTYAFLDSIDCAHTPGAGAERRDRVRIGGEDQNAVLEVLSFPPIVEIRGERIGRPFENDERRSVVVEMDFIKRGQNCHSIGVERRPAGLEHFLQLVPERLVDLLLGDIRGDFGDFGRDVRRRAEEDPLVDSEKEIPSLPLKTGQRGLDFGHFQ